jgi:sulfide:quinone oxidoreductase
MRKHVLILGAGFGGLELATRLSESIRDTVRVTLIDQNDAFVFGVSNRDVMFGRQTRAQVRCPYHDIALPDLEFRQERVTSIDPGTRRVVTDQGAYEPDVLVVALGAPTTTMPRPPASSRTAASSTRFPEPSGSAGS